MNFYEHETNTAARASNGSERKKWRYDNVDPEDLADPFDVAEEARARRALQEASQAAALQTCARPLGALVAAAVMEKV